MQADVGELETIKAAEVAHSQYLCAVAIGKKGAAVLAVLLRGKRVEIVIFYRHHHVARAQSFLPVEHAGAYSLVIDVGPLVGTREDNGVVDARFRIACGQTFDEFIARYALNIGERP